jgi:hypothetical protein
LKEGTATSIIIPRSNSTESLPSYFSAVNSSQLSGPLSNTCKCKKSGQVIIYLKPTQQSHHQPPITPSHMHSWSCVRSLSCMHSWSCVRSLSCMHSWSCVRSLSCMQSWSCMRSWICMRSWSCIRRWSSMGSWSSMRSWNYYNSNDCFY